jgi:hypothetical protein
MLMERFSLAIWNRNKAIVVIVTTICVANVSLLLLGKFFPVSPSGRTSTNMLDISCHSGK